MQCPNCHKAMTEIPGKAASEKLLGAMMPPTSMGYIMAQSSMGNQNHLKGTHCAKPEGCGCFILFLI